MNQKPSRKRSARRGSAFVVVLGMLTVMVLMGIAFATFIETEQAGSTSLKNGLVARQSLNSALGRVIESIDLSFGGVSNEWPVCVWPQPWLASSPWEDHDYIQSARTSGRPDARIITKEVADLLTPSQLAMARSAQVGWAPVFGSIEATSEMGWDKGNRSGDRIIGRGQYRVGGLDSGDSVIGRYAFIALETTGLLDLNKAGGATTVSNSAWHGDPALFLLPASDDLSTTAGSSDNRALDPDGYPIPVILADADAFLDARSGASFTSFSAATTEVYRAFNHDLNKPKNESAAAYTYVPADLFAGFSTSLEELAPDGFPRVRLPGKKEMDELDSAKARKLAARIYRAMTRVFAESWCDDKATSDEDPWTKGYTIFARHSAKYHLSQARLATVSLIDAMDEDSKPGVWGKGSSELVSMWKAPGSGGLPSMPSFKHTATAANGKRVSVTVPEDKLDTTLSSRDDFLNYPCTESVPLVNRVWARIVPDPDGPDFDGGAGSNATMTVYATLEAGAVAGFQNEVPEGDERATAEDFKLEVEWEVLMSVPTDSVAKDDGNENSYKLICGEPDKEKDKKPHRDWFFDGKSMTGKWKDGDVVALRKFNSEQSLTDEAKKKSGILEAFVEEGDGGIPVEIVCRAWGWQETDPKTHQKKWVWRDKVNRGAKAPANAIQGEGAYQNVYFYPVTQGEEDDDANNDDADTCLIVRFKTTVKKGNDIVQQVPAPKLTDGDDAHAWWIRVDPVVYHPKNSLYAGTVGQDEDWWNRDFAAGWAMCLDPVFGFDTSSLYTSGQNEGVGAVSTYSFPGGNAGQSDFHGFWINDAIARTFEKFSATARDKPLKTAMADLVETLDDPDAKDTWLVGSKGAGDKNATHWNYVQKNWLWDTKTDCAPASRWLGRTTGSLPDNLHAYKRNGSFGGQSGSTAACRHGNGGPFLVLGATGKPHSTRTIAGLKSHIRNKPFESAGELGRVRIGPYETLSLFRSYRFGTKHTDIHRVLDWFTVGTDRDPTDPVSVDSEKGTVSYKDGDLFSGLHVGRVNLNAPPVLRWLWNDGNPNRVERIRDNATFIGNPYPVAAAMADANLLDPGYHDTNLGEFETVPMDLAQQFSSALAEFGGIKVTNKYGFWEWLPDYPSYGQTNSVTISQRIYQRVKTRLSDMGAAEDDGVNPLLETVSEYLENGVKDGVAQQLTDEDREAILANTSEALTVRGQTFLVILRADAYTPRYGEETAEDGEGTTLATTHAVIELFRDPRFVRHLDGDESGPPVDKDGNPVFFHNWFVKSIRIL